LDAGQQQMKRERFDLARVAGDCVEMVRPLAGERDIDIHCNLPIVECLGDPSELVKSSPICFPTPFTLTMKRPGSSFLSALRMAQLS